MDWIDIKPDSDDTELRSSCNRFVIRRPAGAPHFKVFLDGRADPIAATAGLNAAKALVDISFQGNPAMLERLRKLPDATI